MRGGEEEGKCNKQEKRMYGLVGEQCDLSLILALMAICIFWLLCLEVLME